MKLTTMSAMYVEELRDLYSAENQLTWALPKMTKAASAPKLRQALTERLHQTQVHLHRLERIFERLGASPKGSECKVIENMITDARHMLYDAAQPAVVDVALIAAAQRIDHYELAGYGCVRNLAQQLGYRDSADALQSILDEKSERDVSLTALANAMIGGAVHAESGRHKAEALLASAANGHVAMESVK